jgi:hypothetical protein
LDSWALETHTLQVLLRRLREPGMDEVVFAVAVKLSLDDLEVKQLVQYLTGRQNSMDYDRLPVYVRWALAEVRTHTKH